MAARTFGAGARAQSPWMLVLYLLALFASPMLFMGKAQAQDTGITGPGKFSSIVHTLAMTTLTVCSYSHRYRSRNHLLLCGYHEGRQG